MEHSQDKEAGALETSMDGGTRLWGSLRASVALWAPSSRCRDKMAPRAAIAFERPIGYDADMKVLQIVPFFYPAWAHGGPVRVAYELSRALARRGHDITVYTTDTLDRNSRIAAGAQVADLDGIRVHYFRNLSNRLASRNHLFLAPSYVKAVRRNLRDFDIVHLHGARTTLNLPAYYYAKKHGVSYVLHAHGTLPRITSQVKMKTLYDKLGGFGILRNASKVMALTETEAEQFRSMGVDQDKIEIVPNGIDPSEYSDLPPRGGWRHQHGIGKDDRLILYLGRIHETKGINLLVEAFADIAGRLDSARLAIVGPDDGYLATLEKLIADKGIGDRISITGPLYGRDKLMAYVDADVFVTPSFYGFPVTFVEACACGLPVVTTQAMGDLDWLDGQAGLVVPFDKDQIGSAITRILTDDKMRLELGENGKMLVRDRFGWPTIAEQAERAYLSCLSRSN